MRRGAWLAGLLMAALLVEPAPARAEVRALESVGVVPLVAGRRLGIPVKDAAIAEAQREAVLQVAGELLLDSATGLAEDQSLEAILGDPLAAYTTRFRILEDRGERPALFSENPDATSEYVLVVEVHVDAGRVRERLVDAGLLEPEGEGFSQLLRVEVRGLDAYGGYQALREALRAGAGATRVMPLELERGRAVLSVRSPVAAETLAGQLMATAPPGLEIDAEPPGPDLDLSLRVRWSPPRDSDATE